MNSTTFRKPASMAAISFFALILLSLAAPQALAAPAVRLALVAAAGSGMEQEAIDRLTDQLQTNNDIKISTVNPDWTGIIRIIDQTDNLALTVRVNASMILKTRSGHILDTIAVQTNKQDFNTSAGTPAPMNKALVDSACREAIDNLTQRAVAPINDAVQVEMQTRNKIVQAMELSDHDNYKEGLGILSTIGAETPHFEEVRALMTELRLEQQALDSFTAASRDARLGKLGKAIAELKQIDAHSKRWPQAKTMIASLRGRLAADPAKHQPQTNGAELKALAAQKKALQAQEEAVAAQAAAIKSNPKLGK